MVVRRGQNSNNTKKIDVKMRFVKQRKALTAIKYDRYCLLNIDTSHLGTRQFEFKIFAAEQF